MRALLILTLLMQASCADYRQARRVLQGTGASPKLTRQICHAARNYPPAARQEIYESAPVIIRLAEDEDEAARILRAAYDH